jgi:HK97 family phage prohead protease
VASLVGIAKIVHKKQAAKRFVRWQKKISSGVSMGWKFFGYAAVFGSPDRDKDVFAHGCFGEFLITSDHLTIPMLNGHVAGRSIGRWLKMMEDGFGLLVIGELNDELPALQPPYPGLSINPINANGPRIPNIWGGKLCRWTDIKEISLVSEPAHQGARVIGAWA